MFCPISYQNIETCSEHVLKVYVLKKLRYGQNTFIIGYILKIERKCGICRRKRTLSIFYLAAVLHPETRGKRKLGYKAMQRIFITQLTTTKLTTTYSKKGTKL